jgi:hypothetical protein
MLLEPLNAIGMMNSVHVRYLHDDDESSRERNEAS